ncbi:hypothetical protein BCR44DRAFT_407097 [Catenaria anguillulae PL171]|uniref:Uncharacterized protein n=1 Tax=Catenaria anguillulae PL171 TaxID=765915 RepID=A0A1Y2H8M7_9FUNG|nr:hypothetical protein BCR44DRAFT_407097 [Catenaria anguillulae PL171]
MGDEKEAGTTAAPGAAAGSSNRGGFMQRGSGGHRGGRGGRGGYTNKYTIANGHSQSAARAGQDWVPEVMVAMDTSSLHESANLAKHAAEEDLECEDAPRKRKRASRTTTSTGPKIQFVPIDCKACNMSVHVDRTNIANHRTVDCDKITAYDVMGRRMADALNEVPAEERSLGSLGDILNDKLGLTVLGLDLAVGLSHAAEWESSGGQGGAQLEQGRGSVEAVPRVH